MRNITFPANASLLVIVLFAWMAAVFPLQAQQRCGTTSYMVELIKQHPEIRRKRMQMEADTKKFVEQKNFFCISVVKFSIIVF